MLPGRRGKLDVTDRGADLVDRLEVPATAIKYMKTPSSQPSSCAGAEKLRKVEYRVGDFKAALAIRTMNAEGLSPSPVVREVHRAEP